MAQSLPLWKEVGLVVEYTILLWLKRKDFSRAELSLTILAGFAIAGGVYGEYYFGSRASDTALKLESISESRVADTRLRAAELEKETVLLRAKLRTHESRANLLMEAHSQELLATLRSFRGQKIDIGQCGRQDNEVTLSVMTLMMLLGSVGWKVNPWNPFFPCTTGMQMVIRHNAPEPTRTAATALSEVLNGIGLTLNAPKPGFTFTPKTHAPDTVFPNPSSEGAVLLIVQLHP